MPRISFRQSGFTLLETLVALVILVVVLSAATISNRVIYNQSSLVTQQIEMGSLADEVIQSMYLQRDTILTSAGPSPLSTFTTYLGLSSGSTSDTVVTGTFKANAAPLNQCANPNGPFIACPPVDQNGPIQLQWCTAQSGSFQCNGGTATSVPAPVQIAGCSTCDSLEGEMAQENGGEVVAVSRDSTGLNAAGKRLVIDAADPTSGSSKAPSTDQTDDWDFYIRTISVINYGSCDPASNSCVSAAPQFPNSTGFYYNTPAGIGNYDRGLRNHTFLVVVKVENYHNPAIALTRTALITLSN
ncbi:prepilin-type N-terminal cleavage/methylation domain-containing protein [Patescibacteria group bacterium]|nr:prepilin-type N-terminal cleavage/methylation domain-containing protein [Patescibacteria group bacterium]